METNKTEKKQKLKKNKGITLIALVITIIVLLILAGVTIATLTGKNGILGKTSEVQFKNDVKQYEEELRLSIYNEGIENSGNRTNLINVPKKDEITGNENLNYENDMKKYIPSFNNSRYGYKLEIRNDELVYIDEKNEQERKWFSEVKLTLAKYFITVNYVDKAGNKLAEAEVKSTTTGTYEIEPKVIEGYEAERPLYEGKTAEDTGIIITYLPESEELSYIGLDSDGNETEDESKIVAYTVSGTGKFTGETLVIPREYSNKPIIKIKQDAFKLNGNIKKVIIPNSINIVEKYAFYCCGNLEYVNINAKKIAGDAFVTNLTKVDIGKNVESIGYWGFHNCSNLTDLTIYSEKLDVNGSQFVNSPLKEVKINESNSKYKVLDGILYSKDGKKIYMYPPAKEGEFTISSDIVEIGMCAFYYNKNITKIDIPNTIESIKGEAFAGCKKLEYVNINAKKIDGSVFYGIPTLTKVDIGKNVESIATWGFRNNSNLTDLTIYSEKLDVKGSQFVNSPLKEVKINESNSKYKVVDGILYSKDGKKIYMYPPAKEGEFTISSDIVEIGDDAFYYNRNLKDIYYSGTIENWTKINKTSSWNNGASIEKVVCIDGNVSI